MRRREPPPRQRTLIQQTAVRWLLSALLVALSVPALAQAPAEEQMPSERPHITMPQLLVPLEPEYPSNGTSDARVILRVTLSASGEVEGIEVEEGDEPFTSAAVRAAQKGRFTPAMRDGVATAATIKVAIDFTYAVEEPPPPEPEKAAPRDAYERESDTPSQPPQEIDIVVRAPRIDDTERAIHKAEARLTAGTFGDPLRAVELLPGITPLLSGVPYFFVRGAPPGSVSFYVDEARIPQLYHVGPGSSVMHPQFVEGVALRSGPYRARYGDATSGVVTTRVNSELVDAGAEVEAKVFESSAYAGAPFARGRGTAAVAGKLSHLGPVLEAVSPEVRLSYWDYQTLFGYRPSPRDQFTLFLFGADDFVGEEENGAVDINIATQFHRLKLGYNRNLEAGVDLHNYVILGVEHSRFDHENELFRDKSIGAGTSLSVVVNDRWEWATGASAEYIDYDASGASRFFGEANNAAVSRLDSQFSLWGEGRYSPISTVHLDAGVRLAAYTSSTNSAVAVEPRLSSTLDLARRWKSILAVGYSTQTPSAAVPAPAVRPAELRGGIQEALQRAATLRYTQPSEFAVEGTLFYNDYFNLSDPLSISTIADPLEVGDTRDGSEPPPEDLNFADRPNGRSVGVEMMLRRPFTRTLSGTVSYTLSRSTRRIGNEDVASSFDRTHILNSTLGIDLGSGYNLSGRFLVYSGLPVREFGVTGGRTGDRSDPFTRIDVRFSKEWQLSWVQLMLIVEMLNAAFQEETLGVSCMAGGCLTATFGPISVPSIGLRGNFGGARSDSADRAHLK